jgi:hypothetical protein
MSIKPTVRPKPGRPSADGVAETAKIAADVARMTIAGELSASCAAPGAEPVPEVTEAIVSASATPAPPTAAAMASIASAGHPSGDPAPSPSPLAMTSRRIARQSRPPTIRTPRVAGGGSGATRKLAPMSTIARPMNAARGSRLETAMTAPTPTPIATATSARFTRSGPPQGLAAGTREGPSVGVAPGAGLRSG